MKKTVLPVVILVLAILTAPLAVEGQQAGKVYRIGYLGVTGRPADHPYGRAFLEGLRELGWVEGQNVVVESRWTEGVTERVDALAAELVRAGVDVIVTTGSPATLAAKRATQTIPIVFASMTDPVERGVVASLARPDGNVTGVVFSLELGSKRVELLKEAAPRVSRVAVLTDPRVEPDEIRTARRQALTTKVRALGIEVRWVDVRAPTEVDAALAALVSTGVNGLIVENVGPLFPRRERICGFAREHRLPAFGQGREFAEAGCLLTYGPNLVANFRRAATYVDRVLRGARPADLPIEQPMKFELFVNMRTAKALGLTIPPSILVRADQVIE